MPTKTPRVRVATSTPKLRRTKTPGIYSRGNRYVVVFRDPSGRQRRRHTRTLAEARDLKATLRADVARGEYRALSKITFAEYAEAWLTTYQGRTARGVRPLTRADYRKRLEQDAIPFFGRMRLAAIEPREIKTFAAKLAALGPRCRACRDVEEKRRACKKCDGTGRGAGTVALNTVRLALAPVKALFATAVEEGLIRSNPTVGLRLAQTQIEDSDAEKVKALTEDELAALLKQLPEAWRPFFTFLSQTGLRISEAIALRWQDIDFGKRRVLVRRRFYRDSFAPPKSGYGRRDVPLAAAIATDLWNLRKESRPADDALVFTSVSGSMVDQSNLASRVLKPAAGRAGVPWVGFHTFRHTCATMLFRHGLNAKQVQVWLGHHSPSFTLDVYVHLLSDDLPEAPFAPRSAETPATSDERVEVAQVAS